jgi:hypothetical protein
MLTLIDTLSITWLFVVLSVVCQNFRRRCLVVDIGNDSDSSTKTCLPAIGDVVTLCGVWFCVLYCVVPICQGVAVRLAAVFWILILYCNAE